MKLIYIFLISLIFSIKISADDFVLIANGINDIDKKTISKIYKGKIVQLNDLSIKPINSSNLDLQNSFLKKYLKMNNEKFIAYWTVRQYIGKGVAPKELNNIDEIINFIENNPGAIGYINKKDLDLNQNIKKYILAVN